jgi:predicted membrane-bound spermidine synthase
MAIALLAACCEKPVVDRLSAVGPGGLVWVGIAAVIGGVIGGLLSSTVIPYVLLQPIEFALASVALLTAGMVWLNGTRTASGALVTAIVLLAPVLGMGFSQTGSASHGGGRLDHYRDLYGHIMIKTDDRSVVLSSDTTTHGSQLTADLAARRRPTLYFTESSGIGRVIENLQATRPEIRVGVIGLGAGTLAAYARKTDAIDFWDIDPKSIRVARENFTFVAESPGKIDLILRDGRKALEESKADYDLIVVDAFTGDGIPSHLLTREAMTVYFKRLEKRGGLLVVQASNRYSRLFPVVEATARTDPVWKSKVSLPAPASTSNFFVTLMLPAIWAKRSSPSPNETDMSPAVVRATSVIVM